MLIYFMTNYKELCKGNLLVLIITLYLKKRVSKESSELGRNGAKIFFLFSYIFNKKMTILAKKLSRLSIEIKTYSQTIYVDENI